MTRHDLIKAVEDGNLDVVKAMLNTMDKGEMAAANEIAAASYNFPLIAQKMPDDVFALLVRRGFLDQTNESGQTPLMRVLTMRTEERVSLAKKLIDAGADVHIKDLLGQDAMFYASAVGVRVIKELRGKGASTEETTLTGKLTPLMLAAAYGHCDVVADLIECRAKIDVTDPHGFSAAMLD